MVMADPQNLPSLEMLFSGHKAAMNAFQKAGFSHIIEPMCMPPESLKSEVPGIGFKFAKLVGTLLARHGLQRHEYCGERMADFLDQQFGKVELAPLMALNVVSFNGEGYTRVLFAPLRMSRALEIAQPGFTIGEFAKINPSTALELIGDQATFGPVRSMLLKNYPELRRRMEMLFDEPAARSQVKLSTAPRAGRSPHLRVVQ